MHWPKTRDHIEGRASASWRPSTEILAVPHPVAQGNSAQPLAHHAALTKFLDYHLPGFLNFL